VKWLFAVWAVVFSIVILRLWSRHKVSLNQIRLCAEQGNPKAQLDLGSMYHEGKGVPQDYRAAVDWYRKAAEQGLPQAQFNLGIMYYGGRGAPQDFVQAYRWLSLATAQGNEGASRFRDMVATRMTPGQIAEAQEMAKNWKPK